MVNLLPLCIQALQGLIMYLPHPIQGTWLQSDQVVLSQGALHFWWSGTNSLLHWAMLPYQDEEAEEEEKKMEAAEPKK